MEIDKELINAIKSVANNVALVCSFEIYPEKETPTTNLYITLWNNMAKLLSLVQKSSEDSDKD